MEAVEKPGWNKHFAQIAFGETARGFLRNETGFDSALLHAFVIDPAPVVFHFNVDVVAAMVGAQDDLTLFGLASTDAIFGAFDSVGHRIANEVHQRIGDLLNDVVIELGFAAGEIQVNQFSGGFGGVTNGARKREYRVPMGTMRAAVISSCR